MKFSLSIHFLQTDKTFRLLVDAYHFSFLAIMYMSLLLSSHLLSPHILVIWYTDIFISKIIKYNASSIISFDAKPKALSIFCSPTLGKSFRNCFLCCQWICKIIYRLQLIGISHIFPDSLNIKQIFYCRFYTLWWWMAVALPDQSLYEVHIIWWSKTQLYGCCRTLWESGQFYL